MNLFLKRGDGELHLLQEHHHYAQVKVELAVIGKECCDFIMIPSTNDSPHVATYIHTQQF